MRRESIATAIGGITAAAALFSLSSQSCGNASDGGGGSGGVQFQPAKFEIIAPRKGDCITASVGDEPYVPISVEISNLQLAPPGVCSQQLTTVTSTATGLGGSGGSGGNNGFSLECGHLSLFACTMAVAKQFHPAHCPFGTSPNNESSGTTVDILVARLADGYDPDPTNPVDKNPTRLLHVDILLTREARTLFELVDAETQIIHSIDDLRILPPGFSCPAIEAAGAGGAGGAGGNGGMGGVGGKH